jgi:DNA-binding MarR family transcriptional regulator
MPETEWLDDGEQQAWRSLLAATTLLDVALDRQLQHDSSLSHAAYGILVQLSEAPGRTLHMHELALATNSSQSRLSHAAARLESLGLIGRSRCPDSRRAVHAHLTETGAALVEQAAPGHVRLVRRLVFDRLTAAQVEQLDGIARTILSGLAEEGLEIALGWRRDPSQV